MNNKQRVVAKSLFRQMFEWGCYVNSSDMQMRDTFGVKVRHCTIEEIERVTKIAEATPDCLGIYNIPSTVRGGLDMYLYGDYYNLKQLKDMKLVALLKKQ